MKSLLRPYRYFGAVLMSAALLVAPPGAPAQSGISHILEQLNPLLSRAQGYLGVLVTDVDNDSQQKLKLKDNHGALITLIDHDAPAGSALRVNDVVLSVNGENIAGAEQFGRMLHEMPAGRKVTLVLIRDGAQQTVTIALVDRKAMEQDVWNKMNSEDVVPPPASGMGIMSGGGDGVTGWHMSLFTSSLHVGALIEPLTSQMADYLGVASGVMVKQVDRKSEAAAAGLKPHDVILRVGADPIATSADWDRALRANEGKTVQITVLREGRQQVLSLQVDSKHKGQAVWTDIFPQESCPEMAGLDFQLDPQLLQELQQQMQELQKNFNPEDFKVDPQIMQDLQRQMEQFKIDPQQMQELRRQMDQFRQSLNQFKLSPGQVEDLQRQMDEFRKNFRFDRQQLEDLRQKFQQLRDQRTTQPA